MRMKLTPVEQSEFKCDITIVNQIKVKTEKNNVYFLFRPYN